MPKDSLNSDKKPIPFPVVAIGASAGGTRALEEFFAHVESIDKVCVLAAQQEGDAGIKPATGSLGILSGLEVELLSSGSRLKRGRVYLVPPHRIVSFEDGIVRLTSVKTAAEKLKVIDALFQSVARTYGEHSVGVILSGDSRDGSLGIEALNLRGGLTIAQNPDTAEHKRMPESAIASGAVDRILPARAMWREILEYVLYLEGTSKSGRQVAIKEQINSALPGICDILQKETRHDLKHYKSSTLERRVQRRMQVLGITSVQKYVEYLGSHAEEVSTLFSDLLINVTSFFRDKESFAVLRDRVLEPLLRNQKSGQKIRIWVPGCSTGEEPYSIAILVHEVLEELKKPPEVQIIATDLDESALDVARRGSYPPTIAEHVSESLLRKYFVKKNGRYHVSKEIRELCLFSIHNLVTDPPFSQLDLISCRNVLIYFGPHLQKKLFPVFHYALRPGGYLFLGTSETLTTHKELFKPISSKHRIAQRKATAIKMPAISTSVQTYLSHFQSSEKVSESDLGLVGQRIALDEMPLKYAIVNDEGQILFSTGGLHKFVQISEGSFQNNIVKLAAPSLRAALRSTFNLAKKEKRKVTSDGCTLKIESKVERVGIIVQPMPQLGDLSELYWVAFQSLGPVQVRDPLQTRPLNESDAQFIEQLENELSVVRQELDKSVQDLEASNEELKSSNEELLSMNEELQSANEELETSKEDVQASNDALQRANSDLENLLASTQIATLFLDDEFRIRGFTPAIQGLYNVKESDIGRKISDFTSLSRIMPPYPSLKVVHERSGDEAEVEHLDGRILLRRILPYKNAEDKHEGIVVAFIDITELRRSEKRFLNLANFVPVITWTTNEAGAVEFFNSRWYEYTGLTKENSLGSEWQVAIHPDDAERVKKVWGDSVLTGNDYVLEYRLRRLDGAYRWFKASGIATGSQADKSTNWFGTCVDIHDQKEKTDFLVASGKALTAIIEAVPQYIWRATPDGAFDYASDRFLTFVGQPKEKILKSGWADVVHPDDKDKVLAAWTEALKKGASLTVDFRIFRRGMEIYTWVRCEGVPNLDEQGKVVHYYGTWTDIHDRVLAENLRKESEERFHIMADNAPALVWIAGTDQQRTWFNKGWLEFTGVSMEASSGKGWYASVHPEDLPKYLDTYHRHFLSKTEFQMDYRLKHHSGEYRWIGARGVPWFAADGSFAGFIGACLDIHESKRAVEAIKSSEAHFRTLVDNSPAMMWITDQHSSCTYLSQTWYDTTGRTPQQDLGFGWIENVHPEDRDAAGKSFFDAAKSRARINLRYRLRHKDGEYRWSLNSGLPRFSDGGEFLGYIGTVIDIHDQIAAVEALEDLRERFQRSTAAIDLGVWYCDLPFDELIWNKEVKEHFFMKPDQRVTIEDFYAHIHPEDREKARRAIQFSIDNHAPYDIVYRTMNPKNPIITKSIRAIGWTDYDSKNKPIRFDGITLDVTREQSVALELRTAKDEAESARRAAELASASKTRFLANMSHEIRTPLSAIIGFSDLLMPKLETDAETKLFVERIARNSVQLGRLIDDLLDLSKIEAGKIEVEKKIVNIDSLIEDVFSVLDLRAQEKSVELSLSWVSEKRTHIITDPIRFSQVLTNIIGNAVKFTEKGRVDVEFQAVGNRLTVRVFDTGIGLSPEEQARIFEPFQQADPSVSRRFGGTGLGLALSKRISKLLGGDLVLERAAPSEGSVFRIEIEIGEPDRAERISGDGTVAVVPRDLSNKAVLVVDDSPDNRLLISVMLSKTGMRIVEASNGIKGVELAQQQKFDVILMDIQMPGMDGYEAIQRLQELNIDVPVVAITAHAFKEERERCLTAGFTAYLTKPVNRENLLSTVSDLSSRKT